MPLEAAITLLVLAAVIVALISNRISADLVLMGALTVLLLFGIVSPERALQGFSNPGIITIACLYVVAAGLMETGAVNWVAGILLGIPRAVRTAQLRVLIPAALLSTFTNNTAVVTMFIPVVQEWGERLKIRPSKLLIPLSYAAILGGTCTLIGTSTNLIVNGLLDQEYQKGLGFFEIAMVGLPVTAVGCLYLFLFADKLLPNRGSVVNQIDEFRQYCLDFEVEPLGFVAGKTVSAAGLRNLNSGYLMEISRGDELFTAIDPGWLLEAGDRLTFIGAPEMARELLKLRGIRPVEHQAGKLEIANNRRCIVELVIGPDFPDLGRTVKESRFRTHYNAVILSLSRDGNRQPGKLGSLEFKIGDTLLVETSLEFVDHYRFRKDFLLVSPLSNSAPPDYSKAPRALLIMAAMIAATATGLIEVLQASLLASAAMVGARCVTGAHARRRIDLRVLIVIAASFGLGAAMKDSGAAQIITTILLPDHNVSPLVALSVVYVVTVFFTEVMTNNAAAVLVFPIAQTFSESLGVSIFPFAVAIMIGGSASFITPLGYQTNLMVYGPGRYKFIDYVKVGTPLSILVAGSSLLIIPLVWNF